MKTLILLSMLVLIGLCDDFELDTEVCIVDDNYRCPKYDFDLVSFDELPEDFSFVRCTTQHMFGIRHCWESCHLLELDTGVKCHGVVLEKVTQNVYYVRVKKDNFSAKMVSNMLGYFKLLT